MLLKGFSQSNDNTFNGTHLARWQVASRSAECAQLMAQIWAGHCSLLMGATAELKDDAVSLRLRQAGDPLLLRSTTPLSSIWGQSCINPSQAATHS